MSLWGPACLPYAGVFSARARCHLVAHQLTDLSADLATVGSRDAAFSLPHGRGDQVAGCVGLDLRELPLKGLRIRDIYTPDLHIDTISTKTRNFH